MRYACLKNGHIEPAMSAVFVLLDTESSIDVGVCDRIWYFGFIISKENSRMGV